MLTIFVSVRRTSNRLFNRIFDLVPPLIALFLALIVASLLLLALDANPREAFTAMYEGAFGTENATAETLVKATPILLVAIGITIAFRGGVINIGGEGQMVAGALASVTVALHLDVDSPSAIMVAATLAGFLSGALYGALAGFLKAYFDVNEILSTIMLNQIAVQMMNYLLNGPLLDPAEQGLNNIPKTARIDRTVQIPRLSFTLPDPLADVFKWLGIVKEPVLFETTRLHYGLILAMVLGVVVFIFLWQTSLGYRVRAVGENDQAARYAGINVKRQRVLAMFLAGGFAGLAGAVQVLGLTYRLQTDGSATGFTGNAGFNGIVAALFGGLHPVFAIPASIFFGGLLVGAQSMQRIPTLGIQASIVTAINGLIVVFVVSSQIFIRRRSKRRISIATREDEAHG